MHHPLHSMMTCLEGVHVAGRPDPILALEAPHILHLNAAFGGQFFIYLHFSFNGSLQICEACAQIRKELVTVYFDIFKALKKEEDRTRGNGFFAKNDAANGTTNDVGFT